MCNIKTHPVLPIPSPTNHPTCATSDVQYKHTQMLGRVHCTSNFAHIVNITYHQTIMSDPLHDLKNQFNNKRLNPNQPLVCTATKV